MMDKYATSECCGAHLTKKFSFDGIDGVTSQWECDECGKIFYFVKPYQMATNQKKKEEGR